MFSARVSFVAPAQAI